MSDEKSANQFWIEEARERMAEKTVEAMIRRAERAEGYLKACLPYLSDNPDLHQPGAELLADSIKSELVTLMNCQYMHQITVKV